MSRRIVVIGDSHSDALTRALRNRRSTTSPSVDVAVFRYRQEKAGKQIGDLTTEQADAMAAGLTPDDLLVSTVGGNQHQVLGLVQHPQPFDFFEAASDAAQPVRGEVIPYAALRAHFDRGLRGNDGKRIARLKTATPSKMIHLMPPPPKADEQHILRRFETAFAAQGTTEHGVTPAPIRLKLWRLQQTVMADICHELGVELMPPPPGTQDRDGFLLPEYYAEDATHANAGYGELVLNQLEKSISV